MCDVFLALLAHGSSSATAPLVPWLPRPSAVVSRGRAALTSADAG
ncbi:hypothetical protein [Nocardioides taihuensis]|uniref:Uncharacterized protein n=1 Tax=Nocardioides taihuensis TaxID=1835606 RepID=A0ABW0BHX7_9ACTN